MDFYEDKPSIDDTLHINRHAIRLGTLEQSEVRLRQAISDTQEELGWYEHFDCDATHSAVSRLKREIQTIQARLKEINGRIESNSAQLSDARHAAAPRFLDRIYQTAERRIAVLQLNLLQERSGELKEEKQNVETVLVRKQSEARALTVALDRYRSFDPLEARAVLAQKAVTLEHVESEKIEAGKKSERWETDVGELAREYDALLRDIRTLELEAHDAEVLYRKFKDAYGPHKDKIRHECEARFGIRNRDPGTVLDKRNGALGARLAHAKKLEERLRERISVHAKEIEKLILDGSNLSYNDGKFIGLGPLIALVPCLSESYAVELWFDPGIVRQTGMDKATLRAMFPSASVKVAFGKGDVEILGSAQHDERSYVISNDGFRDFCRNTAVSGKRIFKHVIHQKSVQIPALDLNVPYQQDPTLARRAHERTVCL